MNSPVLPAKRASNFRQAWRALVPIIVAVVITLLPVPAGLAQHAWYFFALFAGVILALVLEPLPGGAIGLIGVTVATVLSPFVLYSPGELARTGFNPVNAALTWALSGFSNTTVWLIFGAFIFALGYEKTGLGRRIALRLVKRVGRRTLTLGYAIAFADLFLAPFTPSNTARSGGTIFPVIRHLPELYDSRPNDPSARKIGGYIMWVAIAATSVTSSMFVTALAPSLLALEMVKKTTKLEYGWTDWLVAFAPVGVLLLLATPLLTFWLYPPQVKVSEKVPEWASQELEKLGVLTPREITLGMLILLALTLWIFGGDFMNTTTVALLVVSLMLITGVITWNDIIGHSAAWNTLVWFATLVALAGGLNQVGFVQWLARLVAQHMSGISPTAAMIVLVALFFFIHYMFASITAHVTAVLPIMLVIGATIPAMPMRQYAMLLCLTLGIMGIISPYATGPSPVYYGSGYLPPGDYWRLGSILGLIFIGTLIIVGVPWLFIVF